MSQSAWITDRWFGRPGVCWSCAEPARAVVFTRFGWIDGPAGPATVEAWGYVHVCDECSRDRQAVEALQAEAQPIGRTLEVLLREHPLDRHGVESCRKAGRRPTVSGTFPGPLRLAASLSPGGRVVVPESAPVPATPALGDGPDPWDAPDLDAEREADVLDRRMARRRPAPLRD